MKKVYVGMGTDVIHHGHINIIEVARTLGEITVGLLSDKAVAVYARVPFLSYEERKKILENIKGVKEVIYQEELDYTKNLRLLKPDYVVHGDDWKTGPQKPIREKVVQVLKEWGGELVEPPYTKGVSASNLRKAMIEIGTTPDIRRKMLRRLLEVKPIVRVMEAHNGMSGLLVQQTNIIENNEPREFDAIWISSLTDSTAKGKPDTEYVDKTSRFQTINDVLDVTTKPIILDGDTGGIPEHFAMFVKNLERLGVSAVVIEDKVGVKRNSLFGTDVLQQLDTIENFCNKISSAKKALVTDEFMIFARLESLIAGKGQEDAIERAKAYISAGADGIMIHSRHSDGKEIMDFMKAFNKLNYNVPVISVPSAYNQFTEKELQDAGFSIVIYANHLLRSAFPAMQKTAESILRNTRSLEADEFCISIKEVLKILPN